ncbi:hypothetical protein EYF80_049691 [Liparis tanakae]|uniref:Uncharacterized protein n=1 Tax=Liparis tanakae TaxID=230148 RepID=A0A4Z2FIM2_9TELE|nr:hypothetical protein EYF80_049691 [Liparis tanakae]
MGLGSTQNDTTTLTLLLVNTSNQLAPPLPWHFFPASQLKKKMRSLSLKARMDQFTQSYFFTRDSRRDLVKSRLTAPGFSCSSSSTSSLAWSAKLSLQSSTAAFIRVSTSSIRPCHFFTISSPTAPSLRAEWPMTAMMPTTKSFFSRAQKSSTGRRLLCSVATTGVAGGAVPDHGVVEGVQVQVGVGVLVVAQELLHFLLFELGLGVDEVLELLVLAEHLGLAVEVLLVERRPLQLQGDLVDLVLDSLQLLVDQFELLRQVASLLAVGVAEDLGRRHEHGLQDRVELAHGGGQHLGGLAHDLHAFLDLVPVQHEPIGHCVHLRPAVTHWGRDGGLDDEEEEQEEEEEEGKGGGVCCTLIAGASGGLKETGVVAWL